MNDQDITKEIKRVANLKDVISQYVALKPTSRSQWKGCCPFHEEKTPSFHVSESKGIFKCFGCSVSGDQFTFIQLIEGLNFSEARSLLAERYNIKLDNKDLTPDEIKEQELKKKLLMITNEAAKYYQTLLESEKGKITREYAKKRGISEDILDKFRIGLSPEGKADILNHLINKGFKSEEIESAGLVYTKSASKNKVYLDRFRNRLMFPIAREDGKVIAFGGRALEEDSEAKYMNSPEGILFYKRTVLYGLNIARKSIVNSGSVIICEGFMDAIMLHEAGFTNSVAVLGTALTDYHINALKRLNINNLYLAFDSDEAGKRAAFRTWEYLKKHDINSRVVILPEGHDPDTFIREYGREGFEEHLNNACSLPQFCLERVLEPYDTTQPAERRQSLKEAAEIIRGISSHTEKLMYITWLAERYCEIEGISDRSRVRELEQNIKKDLNIYYVAPKANKTKQKNREKIPGFILAQRSLITAMLQESKYRDNILDSLEIDDWEEVFKEIITLLNDNRDQSSEDLSEFMDLLDENSQNLITELLFTPNIYNYEESIPFWIKRVKEHIFLTQAKTRIDSIKSKLIEGVPLTEEEELIWRSI